MNNLSYYRILTDTDNNFANDNTFLQVNCAGHSYFKHEVRGASIRSDYYLMYLFDGNVKISQPLTGTPLLSGDMIVFPAGEAFNYFKPAGEMMEYYWVHFTGAGAAGLLNSCGIEVGKILTPGNHETICEKFRRLFNVFLSRDKFFEIEAGEKLTSLLITFGKLLEKPKENYKHARLGGAIRLIHENMSKDISVEELAAAEHMSPSHFRAVFKEQTGLSPKDYVTLCKLNYACELLRQTDCSIKSAGAAAGYPDPQYFSRIFKRRLGTTPAEYRSRNR